VEEAAEAGERKTLSLRLWPASLDQCSLGARNAILAPAYVVDSFVKIWSLGHAEVTTATKQNDFVDD
jgi:hypothetical protein